MKLSVAMELIRIAESGYRIHFEIIEGGVIHSDFFPDRDEPLIKDLDTAWDIARRFAKAVDLNRYVNIYVVDEKYTPVGGYEKKTINKR